MPSDVFPSGKLRLKDLLHDFSEVIFFCNQLLCDTPFKAVYTSWCLETFFLQLIGPAQEEDTGSQSGLLHHKNNFPKDSSGHPMIQSLTGKTLVLISKFGQIKISEIYLLPGRVRKTEAMFSATDTAKTFLTVAQLLPNP